MEPFVHGVASGDPLADRVVIWTRVTVDRADPVDVGWTVATDADLRDVVASGKATADPSTDHTVKVDVAGLEPSSTYFYGFEALGARSPVGRTKTLPRGSCERARFAIYSCAKYSAGYFNAYARMAERDDLDVVLCLGDYIYEYGNDDKGLGAEIGRAFEPPHPCVTLDDYRTRYAQYRRDPDVQHLHHRHALIAMPDDHEICDDTWRDGASKHDPDRDGDWATRKAAALRAWSEWLPVRLPDPGDPTRLFRRFRLGALADLLILDTRTRRDQQKKGPEIDDPQRTLLGAEQFEWFTQQLAASDGTWRLVCNGVMMGQVFSDLMPEDIGDPLSELGVLAERDHGPEPDQWDGYPAERERVLRYLEDRDIGNVVFLSGDVHSSWALEIKHDPHDPEEETVAVEFAATSVTSENLDEETHSPPRTKSLEIEKTIIEKNPHIEWCELDSHGYTVVDVDPERVRATWYFVDEVVAPHDGESRGASWEVRSGERQLLRASDDA